MLYVSIFVCLLYFFCGIFGQLTPKVCQKCTVAVSDFEFNEKTLLKLPLDEELLIDFTPLKIPQRSYNGLSGKSNLKSYSNI